MAHSVTKDKTVTAFHPSNAKPNKFYLSDKFGWLYSYEFENFVERTKLLHKFENKLTAILEIDSGKILCGDAEGNLYQLGLGPESPLQKIAGPQVGSPNEISGRIRKLMLLPDVGYA
jgi:hypothetical protein